MGADFPRALVPWKGKNGRDAAAQLPKQPSDYEVSSRGEWKQPLIDCAP
jgi:hypothetical protein